MPTWILDMRPADGRAMVAASCADSRTTNPAVEQAWRNKLVREAAYFRSQERGPGSGKELEDWLAAEREVDESLGYRRG